MGNDRHGYILSVASGVGWSMSRVSEATMKKRQRRDVGYKNFNRMLDLILQEGVNRYVNAKSQLERSEGRSEGHSNAGLS
jgi:hypothetical protein